MSNASFFQKYPLECLVQDCIVQLPHCEIVRAIAVQLQGINRAAK